MIERSIIIGDVHGCYHELLQLLDQIDYSPSRDRLISCGDLVEKGPLSNDVVEMFRRTPNTVAIKGNHEDGLLRFWKHEERARKDPKYKNPMDPYQDRIDCLAQMSEENLRYLDGLPWYYRFEASGKKFLVLHGGIFPNTKPEAMKERVLCRLRYMRSTLDGRLKMVRMGDERPDDVFWADAYGGEWGHALFGHSPFEQDVPKKFPHATGLDLAGVYGGHLCAFDAETMEHHCLKVETKYAKPIMIMKRRPE